MIAFESNHPNPFHFSTRMNIYRGEMPPSFREQAIEKLYLLSEAQLTELIYRLNLDERRLPPPSKPLIETIKRIPELCEREGISWNELLAAINSLLEPPRGAAYKRFQQMRSGWGATAGWEGAPVSRPTQASPRSDVHRQSQQETADAPEQRRRLIVRVLDLLEKKDEETIEWLMDVFLGEEKAGSGYSKRRHLDGIAPLVSFVRLVAQRPGDLEQLHELLTRM